MKNNLKRILFTMILFCFTFSVKAANYPIKTLIPIDTSATVDTDVFTYQDFIYNSSVDDRGNNTITFSQIINHTDKRMPVSINLLLFNGDKKNIGYLTYCSDKDLDSEYNQFKIDGGGSSAFSVNVSSRYFGIHEEKSGITTHDVKYSPSDVKYIAVMDDNKYCQVGGYNNYVGKSIDQILGNGEVSTSNTKDYSGLIKIIEFIAILAVIVGIGVLIYKILYPKFSSRKFNDFSKSSKENDSGDLQDFDLDDDGTNTDMKDDVIDLSYHDTANDGFKDISSSDNSNNMNDLINISQGEIIKEDERGFSVTNTEENTGDNNNSNDDGESDLSKFFR